jgi:hypothetical protein
MEQLIKSTTNRREERAMAQLMKSTTNRRVGGARDGAAKKIYDILSRGA